MVARRQGRARRGEWTAAHKHVLRDGLDSFPAWGPWPPRVSSRLRFPGSVCEIPAHLRPDVQAAWEFFRDEILSEWTDPDARPIGWWWFDSPQPRNETMTQAEQLKKMEAGK